MSLVDELLQAVLGDEAETDSRLASLVARLGAEGWTPGAVADWSSLETERWLRRIIECGIYSKNWPLAAVTVELLAARRPDTVRGVMYAVVSHGWLPDTSDKSYNRIQRLLNTLRKRGVVPFGWVVDNIRQTIKPSSWTGLDDFADTVAEAYRRDFWASLPECVEIIVEKDTVAGKIAPVTRDYDVALHPLRGYSSTTFTHDIAQRWDSIDKPVVCYYVGDHDPSGRDLERSVYEEIHKYLHEPVTWHRLAVNPEHFQQFDITPLKPKRKDRRYQAFVSKWGTNCAEAEAVPADELRCMVRDAIEAHIPAEQWRQLQEIEQQEKATWREMMAQLDGEDDGGAI